MKEITREVMWNTGLPHWGMIMLDVAVFLIVTGYLFWQIRKHYQWWKVGKEEELPGSFSNRFVHFLKKAIFQQALLTDKWPGYAHILLYSGFVVLFIGTCIIAFREYVTVMIFGWDFFKGGFYLSYSFLLDFFGLFTLAGLLYFSVRRWILKPRRLNYSSTFNVSLLLLFLVIITGYLVEGSRIAITRPAFEQWSFVGWAISGWFPPSPGLHRFLWWIHFVLSVGFILAIMHLSLRHIFISSLHQFYSFQPEERKGALKPIPMEEFEKAESFGISTVKDYTWKQLFSADACTECGRCQDVCPANTVGKALSPKMIMVKSRDYWLASLPELDKDTTLNEVVPTYISPEEIWACTNCRACVEICPVGIDQVEIIDEIRRNLVMVKGEMPESLEGTMRNMEAQGNPWGMGAHRREEWLEGLNIPLMREKGSAEVLFYVGCAGAFNDRNRKTTVAFARILQAAGVDFAVLGEEEKCCGDQARRAGNEYLFQMMAAENLEIFNRYGVKKIVTTCPHGYHTLKKEYAMLGGQFEVYHHTEFIAQLLKEGRLKINAARVQGDFTYHDSCFLSRYNGIFEEPRFLLNQAGIHLKELPRTKTANFCCGAGGARMWMEEEKDQRVNIERSREIYETGAKNVALGCPFCMTMIEDGLKEFDESKKVYDVAEIIAMGIE